MGHRSHVTRSHVTRSRVTGHSSQVTVHRSQVTRSWVAGHRLPGHRSRVTGHRSRFTAHRSRVTGHGSQGHRGTSHKQRSPGHEVIITGFSPAYIQKGFSFLGYFLTVFFYSFYFVSKLFHPSFERHSARKIFPFFNFDFSWGEDNNNKKKLKICSHLFLT